MAAGVYENVFIFQLSKGNSFCFGWLKNILAVIAVSAHTLFLPIYYDTGGDAYK